MLFKLYRNLFKEEPPKARKKLFARLYNKYGVELIGVWKNVDNPLEKYMLTKYRDEDHYQEFVKAVQDIPEYIEMTKQVSKVRLNNEIVDLEWDWTTQLGI